MNDTRQVIEHFRMFLVASKGIVAGRELVERTNVWSSS